jgi:hypothetical protein
MSAKHTPKQVRAAGTWSTQAGFVYCVDSVAEKLMCFVTLQSQGLWGAMALSRPLDATSEQDVLDAHAHQMIGSYASAVEALRATESFAAAWLKDHRATRSARCPCPPIAQVIKISRRTKASR